MARRRQKHAKQPKIPIPFLPDEIIVKIFEYIPPEIRPPLRLVCKRFGNLERTIGNRTFDFVGVILYSDHVQIVAKTCYKHCYLFETKADEEFEVAIPGISKFFKGATAEKINFEIEKDRASNPSLDLFSILNLITVERLLFYLYCDSDFSGFIDSFFENFHNDHLNDVTFIWQSLKYQNLARLQEAMMQLPILDSVSVIEPQDVITCDPESFVLNGPLMLTMIRTAPDIILYSVHCTTEDLLDAFEIICESGTNEDVMIFVVRSATDDLITVAKEHDFVVDRKTIIDYPRGFEMTVYRDSRDASNQCCRVWICPISARDLKKWKAFLVNIGQGTAWNPRVLNPLLEKAALSAKNNRMKKKNKRHRRKIFRLR